MANPTSTLSNWKPYEQKIDASTALGEGQFVSGTFTMIAAGPPRLSAVGTSRAAATGSGGGNWALPIGLVQNFTLSHNRPFARFWELGSERSYFISGRTTAQAAFSRVMYHGPSLLRMLYSFYEDLINPTLVDSFGTDFSFRDASKLFLNAHDVKIPPGYENVFLNLASDLFAQPCGLFFYMKDSNEQTVAAAYLEETYVPNHTIAVDANGVVYQENVALQPERVVPVNVASVTLSSVLKQDALLNEVL